MHHIKFKIVSLRLKEKKRMESNKQFRLPSRAHKTFENWSYTATRVDTIS